MSVEFENLVEGAEQKYGSYHLNDTPEVRANLDAFRQTCAYQTTFGNSSGDRFLQCQDDQHFYHIAWSPKFVSKNKKYDRPASFAIFVNDFRPYIARFGLDPADADKLNLCIALRQHDWTYEMADDHAAYTKGGREEGQLREQFRTLHHLPLSEREEIVELAGIKRGRFTEFVWREFLN